MATKGRKDDVLSIPEIRVKNVTLHLIGDSPLLSHRFSDASKQKMFETQTKQANKAREALNPKAEYEGAFYPLIDGYYTHPAIAFKKSMVNAIRQIDGITMTMGKGVFHIFGEKDKSYVFIKGSTPRMREDMTRVSGPSKAPKFTYRPEFVDWWTTIILSFNENGKLSLEQLVNLINIAGNSVGVGDWRVECSGVHGMLHVATEKESKKLLMMG